MTQPSAFPVSVKGVVVHDGRVLLLENDRDEWELPGGRIEIGETPEDCVAREIAEESGWRVTTGPILDSWMYYISIACTNVFIVTYGCHLVNAVDAVTPVLSDEHHDIALFAEAEVYSLDMPAGYKRSIAAWFAHLRTSERESVT